MKAQLLSRRVWDILQAVPLNPSLLEAFQQPAEGRLPELLDPTSPQKLMYSLHIIGESTYRLQLVSYVKQKPYAVRGSPLTSRRSAS